MPSQHTGVFAKSLREKAECPDLTSRSLRHFHASVALEASKNPIVVAERIGHSKPSTTMNTYSHVLPGWQSQMGEAVAKKINGESRVLWDKPTARGLIALC